MREMTCIVCPNGCHLTVNETNDEILVKGNLCPRGKDFAIQEIHHPMRTITSTVKTVYKEVPTIPIKVSKEFPKERIFDVMNQINHIQVDYVAQQGDVLMENVLGLGINIVVTSNILKETIHE